MNEAVQLDITWEELEEQKEANDRKERLANAKKKIKKYV